MQDAPENSNHCIPATHLLSLYGHPPHSARVETLFTLLVPSHRGTVLFVSGERGTFVPVLSVLPLMDVLRVKQA